VLQQTGLFSQAQSSDQVQAGVLFDLLAHLFLEAMHKIGMRTQIVQSMVIHFSPKTTVAVDAAVAVSEEYLREARV